jgi:hypothetical protein
MTEIDREATARAVGRLVIQYWVELRDELLGSLR